MINFAVIGTSKITCAFIEAAKQDPRFNLYAVYSRQLETAQTFAEKHKIAHCYTDLSELANASEVNAVYIASPNNCHEAQTLMMINAGKHVLCEKPIAINTAQLTRMIMAAKHNNVCFMEAMLISFLPNYLQIKKHLHAIGTVRKYSASFCQLSSRYPAYLKGENPNTFNLFFGNGGLMDIGIYPLYPIIDLFGLPNKVASQCSKLASGVDGYGDVLLSYSDHSVNAQGIAQTELQGLISYSKVSHGANLGELQGDKGRINWQHSSLFNEVTLTLNNGEVHNISVAQTSNRMTYELSHFIDLIEQGKIESPINHWQLSEQVLSVIEQVRAQQGIIYPEDTAL
ncbi:Gfo/Idh/MocA family oxidoreductase [Colwellia sp. D2M02]|uniref:Scyllo-inositol 2-dehydrogenase n=1 Tax=Colwellia asteriadis TaxID=517723 RepID=A0ABN1LAY7_9GAMM|nr:Gfo/Idh/MocA family oxidoreductase [Colwellia sp. D2M02]MBU2894350.1 Gfo/Idh/MocA family oxidoreductase [Colwellia sp. D2M02]